MWLKIQFRVDAAWVVFGDDSSVTNKYYAAKHGRGIR